MARSFEQIYANAPKAAVGRLVAFRNRYTPHYEEHHGKLYRVWDIDEAGADAKTIVFLPSAMGHGEIWFPFMLELRSKYRVIAISFADDESPDEFAGALLEILTNIGVDKMMIVANSVGGLIAEIMAHKAPERILGLALMMTGAPAADLDAASRQKWELRRKLKTRFRFQAYSPSQKLGMANNVFDSICPKEHRENSAFWLGYIEETFAEYVYKAQHIAINTALVPNIYAGYNFTQGDFSSDMPVLIMESAGDKLYTLEERECLKRLFPNAQVVDIGGAGQFSLQLYEGPVNELLSEFGSRVFEK